MKTSSFLLKLAVLLGALQGNTNRIQHRWAREDNGGRGGGVLWVCVIKHDDQYVLRTKAICGNGRRQAPSSSPHTYPFTPFLGGLLLNCRVCLCLNLGGPLRGVIGPWLGAGGPRAVVSAILAVPGWLLCLQALWRVEENEDLGSQKNC